MKILIISGSVAGLLLNFLPGLGRLPGDIIWRKGNFTFYFPVVTGILVSILLKLFFNFFNHR